MDLIGEYVQANIAVVVTDGVISGAFGDLLSEIPIVKTLIAFGRLARGVNDYIFVKKICRFLYHAGDVSAQERRRFLESMDGGSREELIDDLILVLDKQDRLKKVDLLGRLFVAYVRNILDEEEFWSLEHAVTQADINTFPYLFSFYEHGDSTSIPERLIYSFVVLGVINVSTASLGKYDSTGISYTENELGRKMVGVLR